MADFNPDAYLSTFSPASGSVSPAMKRKLEAQNLGLSIQEKEQKLNEPDIKKEALKNDIKISDVQGILDTRKQLENLLKFKSGGFEGEGIDTGPLLGGVQVPFVEDPILKLPAFISQWKAEKEGKTAGAADRAELRRQELALVNPLRKTTTGAQASMAELMNMIFPQLPKENEQDKGYYRVGLGALKSGQEKLLSLFDTLEKTGNVDISGFAEERGLSPEMLIQNLVNELEKTGTGPYSFKGVHGEGGGKTVLENLFGNKSAQGQPAQQQPPAQSNELKNLSTEELLNQL